MSEPMTRGHVILHTANFLQQSEPALRRQLDLEASLELRTALEEMSAATFYPRHFQTELLRALAGAGGGGTAGYTALRECGAALRTMKNDFNTLLMKVLTPELFIKKLPRFWQRDQGAAGACEVERLDAAARQARVRLRGIGGYDHVAVFWLGFVESVLGELAGARAHVQQSGWSLHEPAPSEVVYEVKWS